MIEQVRLRRHAAESQYDSDHWRHSWPAADFTNHWLQRFALVIARANHEMHRADPHYPQPCPF